MAYCAFKAVEGRREIISTIELRLPLCEIHAAQFEKQAAAGTQDADPSAAGKPIYPLREGASALLVPMVPQPPEGISPQCIGENSSHEVVSLLYYCGRSDAPVFPGDRIATSQGERRVAEVQAIDVARCLESDLAGTGWGDSDWISEHGGKRWAWMVAVEAEKTAEP